MGDSIVPMLFNHFSFDATSAWILHLDLALLEGIEWGERQPSPNAMGWISPLLTEIFDPV